MSGSWPRRWRPRSTRSTTRSPAGSPRGCRASTPAARREGGVALIDEGLRAAPAVRAAADAVEAPAWVVGGAVRDAALGRPVIDADLAVEPGREEPAAKAIANAAG